MNPIETVNPLLLGAAELLKGPSASERPVPRVVYRKLATGVGGEAGSAAKAARRKANKAARASRRKNRG